jgi:hypothetical protein
MNDVRLMVTVPMITVCESRGKCNSRLSHYVDTNNCLNYAQKRLVTTIRCSNLVDVET